MSTSLNKVAHHLSHLRSLMIRALHRHRKAVGWIPAGGPIVFLNIFDSTRIKTYLVSNEPLLFVTFKINLLSLDFCSLHPSVL